MDPITHAAKVFLDEAEAFWRTEPGRILPMIAEPSSRGAVVLALRLHELAPDNRRPLFLYEEPFTNPGAYFEGLAEAIMQDYAQIREGAGAEGVTLPPFPANAESTRRRWDPMQRAVLAWERAAALLGDRFEGLCLALVPTQVADGSGWRESIATLQRLRLPSRVRIAVFAPPSGPLKDILSTRGAHLCSDEDALGDHLHQTAPTTEEATLPPVTLRRLLLDATERAAAGEYADAAARYAEARAGCAEQGRPLDEAMVLIALGGTCLAAGARELAIKSYRRATEIAEAEQAWAVVCQAWFGVGGAHSGGERYHAAATAYHAAAEAAKRAEVPELHLEALRRASTCLRLGGAEDGENAVVQKRL